MAKNDPDREIGFLLSDVSRLMRRDFDRRAQRLGLTRSQWSVLARLARNEGLKQTELADLLEVQPITLARQLDRLECGGWVIRRSDAEDRRVRRVHLAEQARPVLEDLRRLGSQTRSVALRGLDADTRRALGEMLARMRDNLTT